MIDSVSSIISIWLGLSICFVLFEHFSFYLKLDAAKVPMDTFYIGVPFYPHSKYFQYKDNVFYDLSSISEGSIRRYKIWFRSLLCSFFINLIWSVYYVPYTEGFFSS